MKTQVAKKSQDNLLKAQTKLEDLHNHYCHVSVTIVAGQLEEDGLFQ